jgi:hypothetical protein
MRAITRIRYSHLAFWRARRAFSAYLRAPEGLDEPVLAFTLRL